MDPVQIIALVFISVFLYFYSLKGVALLCDAKRTHFLWVSVIVLFSWGLLSSVIYPLFLSNHSFPSFNEMFLFKSLGFAFLIITFYALALGFSIGKAFLFLASQAGIALLSNALFPLIPKHFFY